MKDIFGNTLEIGDVVAFNPPWYKGLVIGKVVKFAPKKVTVSYVHQKTEEKTSIWSYDCVKQMTA